MHKKQKGGFLKCNITIHGLLEEFVKNLPPKARAGILRDILHNAVVNGERENLYWILRKYAGNGSSKSLLDSLPKQNPQVSQKDTKGLIRTQQMDRDIAAANKLKATKATAQISKENEYSEEGSASLDEIRNEFDMTFKN